jgi:hypothetical protein
VLKGAITDAADAISPDALWTSQRNRDGLTEKFTHYGYENARNEAMSWLGDRGFKAEQLKFGKFGEIEGRPIGMQSSDRRAGFRVEFDSRHGAHINV